MKLKVLTLALGLGALSFSACTNQSGKNVSLKNEVDSVNYSLGASIGTSLSRSGIESIDKDIFFAAMETAIANDSLKIQPADADKLLRTYMQKLRAAKSESNKKAGEDFLAANKQKDGVVTLESGLQYRIIREGEGAKPTATDVVKVHYKGTLIDGKEFDSSYSRNEPTEFPANRVIKGWTEALQLMPVGSKWELYIPQNLAYGARGSRGGIDPFSALIFEVELLDIVKKEDKKN